MSALSHLQPDRAAVAGNKIACSTAAQSTRPPMVSADLFGRHTYNATKETAVHIWRRGDSILARGYFNGVGFCERLGTSEQDADARLHELLCELARGTFEPPSQRRKRVLPKPLIRGLT